MPKTGKNYITQTGLPVKVIAINSDNLFIQSLATDNRFYVSVNYPLYPFNHKRVIQQIRQNPYLLLSERINPKNFKNKKVLSAVIDELLLSVKKYTMKGLVREVKRRASAQCKGKDVAANIRARMYWLKKRNKIC